MGLATIEQKNLIQGVLDLLPVPQAIHASSAECMQSNLAWH